MKLLNIDANPKTVKGQKYGFKTAILYLAPGRLSGTEMCPNRSKMCFKDCLFHAGRGRMPMVFDARIRKTKWLHEHHNLFMLQLKKELESHYASCLRSNFVPVARLNGTADWPWEEEIVMGKTLFEWFPKMQFYDYTKSYNRMVAFIKGEQAPNYNLTFSLSEDNEPLAKDVLKNGGNVAVVFRTMPSVNQTYLGYPIYDGDQHDLRFTDPVQPHIIALVAKGKAKKTEAIDQFVKEKI